MERTILNTIRAMETSDGAGVRLKRQVGLESIVGRPGFGKQSLRLLPQVALRKTAEQRR